MSLPWNEKVTSFQVNPESATIADIVRMAEELVLLQEFYRVWQRCESNRGCYSCCEAHDCRCQKAFHPDSPLAVCVCGRDDLDRLEGEINEILNR